jgi:hypothetical protein
LATNTSVDKSEIPACFPVAKFNSLFTILHLTATWYNQLFPGWLDMKHSADLEGCLNTITSWEIPISLYVMPRLLQAVITSACMVAIYVLANRLLGQVVALAAIILLILEPFFLGISVF